MVRTPRFNYFIGHKSPEFKIWDGFEFYVPNTEVFQQKGHLKNGNLIGEYASLFMLCDKLNSENLREGSITICQYRRFVLNVSLGMQSENVPWCRFLTPDQMRDFDPGDKFNPLNNNVSLLATPISIPNGILSQYGSCHHIRDIMMFSATLIDFGLLEENEVSDFLNSKVLIPSPSCGTFEIAGFMDIIDILQKATDAFFSTNYKIYTDHYQQRVIGFLLERLHSFLLIKNLSQKGLNPFEMVGFTTVVSGDSFLQRSA